MNKLIPGRLGILSALLFILNTVSAQDFSWIKGTNLTGQFGDYGTIGVPAPSNKPGGREGAATWKDAAGNFWMYGGDGYDHISNQGLLNDLWKYTVSSNQWTYVKGDMVFSQVSLYAPMGTSTSWGKPGGRHSCASWADASGNLWLFGGWGYAGGSGIGYLNDLWKYNIGTGEWTWVNGGSICFQPGQYGTVGVPSSTNTPGARMGAVTWTDGSGNLWLFGGYGTTTNSITIGWLNDVWRYNIANNEWTWMKGTNLKDQNGIYGTMGTPAAANNPGSRSSTTGWTDGSGNFWMFGGEGFDQTSSVSAGMLNDLWKYNMSSSEWTWIKGSNTISQLGVYGLQGIANAANMPGGRSGSVSWRDGVGNVWLFGGRGFPGATAPGADGLNDLWKYNTSANEWTWIKGTSLLNQSGTYGTIGIPAQSNIPGSRTRHANWIDGSDDLYIFGGQGYAASGPSGSLNDLWKYTNCFINPVTMTVTANDSIICAGESASLTAIGGSNYLWLHSLATTGYAVISPTVNTTYTVLTSDAKGCRYFSVFTETVSSCAGLNAFTQQDIQFKVFPNPGNGTFIVRAPDDTELLILNAVGQQVYQQTLTPGETQVRTSLSKGLYYYRLRQSEKIIDSGRLLVE